MKTKLMALAALQYARRFMRPTECDIEYIDKQIAAIKAVIETPAEPVQWQVCRGGDWEWCKDDEVAFYKSCNLDVRPLYTTAQEPASGWMPDGCKLVPIVPTREMCAAAVKYANGDAVYKNVAAAALEIEEGIYGEAYSAMLAAAPGCAA